MSSVGFFFLGGVGVGDGAKFGEYLDFKLSETWSSPVTNASMISNFRSTTQGRF